MTLSLRICPTLSENFLHFFYRCHSITVTSSTETSASYHIVSEQTSNIKETEAPTLIYQEQISLDTEHFHPYIHLLSCPYQLKPFFILTNHKKFAKDIKKYLPVMLLENKKAYELINFWQQGSKVIHSLQLWHRQLTSHSIPQNKVDSFNQLLSQVTARVLSKELS